MTFVEMKRKFKIKDGYTRINIGTGFIVLNVD